MQHFFSFRHGFFLSLACLVVAGFSFGAIALAQEVEFRTTEKDVVAGNLIKVAQVIDVQSPVTGDVIVIGKHITIAGPVSGDVIAVGETIVISGDVEGSIRVAGSSITISGIVDHNVYAVGSTIDVTNEASVAWDVMAWGQSVHIAGPVDGSVWATGETITIDSQVGRDLVATVNTGKITLQPNTSVAGTFTYQAVESSQLELKAGATTTGQVIYKEVAKAKDYRQAFQAFLFIFRLIGLFGLLALGLILTTLLPKKLLLVQDEMVKQPWRSLGVGALVFFLAPPALFLLVFTVLGIPLMLFGLGLYFLVLYLSKVFFAFTVGMLILNRLQADQHYRGGLFWAVLLGAVTIFIVASLPFFGMLITFIGLLWTLGAFLRVERGILREYR